MTIKPPTVCPSLKETTETIRGRQFRQVDIRLIQQLVRTHFKSGRTHISEEVCKALNWRQPNGWLKDRACRDALRVLESKEYIALPISKVKLQTTKTATRPTLNPIDEPVKTPLTSVDFRSITIRQVKGTRDESHWNALVRRYHYLGFSIFVGRSLKYIVHSKDRIIALLGFCDPAWALAQRDEMLVKSGINREDIKLRGINNGRFLILPWINIPNLASHVLSLIVRRLKKDWSEYYSIEPLFVETFVDPDRFAGTCYKAANWIHIGETVGYSKTGNQHRNSQKPKLIYFYPFGPDLRERMTSFLKDSQ